MSDHSIVTSPVPALSAGRRIAKGFLTVFAFLSGVGWTLMVIMEGVGSLLMLSRYAKGFDVDGVIVVFFVGLAALDLVTANYQRRSYFAKSLDPSLNRRMVIFTALSVIVGSLPFVLDPGPHLMRQPLLLMAILFAFRGPVVLASGLPYLLNRIPWHDNLPPQP